VFELEPAGPPTATGLSANVENGARTLTAQVSPAGAETHAYFEYGTASCASVPSPCASTSPASIGGGFGGRDISAELPNLEPGAYDYRVVAESSKGKLESAEHTFTVVASLGALPDGRQWEMVSPPEKDGAEPEAITKERGAIEAAADGAAITYVADGPIPAQDDPEGNRSPEPTQILSTRDREAGHDTWESQDIMTPNTTGSGTNPGLPPEYEFFSSSLALALVDPFRAESGPFETPPLSPPLEGENEGEQENTPYLRADAPLEPASSEAQNYDVARANGAEMKPQPNPGFLPLITKLNEPGKEFGLEIGGKDPEEEGIYVQGVTPDLGHVVLISERKEAKPGLYEWTGNGTKSEEGTLQQVSLLPGNETLIPAPEAGLGSGAGSVPRRRGDVRHAISNDGSLVFWSWEGPNPAREDRSEIHLYARDTQLQETIELSAEEEKQDAHAIFQTASANGSKVFFTDTQRLTPEANATQTEPDLYVAELQVVEGHLSSKITDLTPQAGADLLLPNGQGDGVIGASEDEEEHGSYVYFVANGALTTGAARGHCSDSGRPRPAGTTCNLYVRHYDASEGEWEPAKLVAALSQEDLPGFDLPSTNLLYMTSRVSPNGRYLAFMSNRRLTGYDNIDQDEKTGHHADEEVYLYDAYEESLACASCNPSGARPTGVLDTKVASGEGLTLVVDRQESWAEHGADHWLSGSVPGWDPIDTSRSPYQSRYLSDSGRLFFNSADPLVPAGTVPNEKRTKIETTNTHEELEVGVENVYEYEPGEVGGCDSEGGCVGLVSSGTSEHESAFLDASANGNDVFFLTAAQIASQDHDTNFDVYDAHVCDSESPCAPAPEAAPEKCEEESCQGAAPVAPSLTSPAVSPFITSGNLAPPKQEVLGEKQAKAPTKPPAKPLTRAQKLAKALKACRKDKKTSKRVVCEKQARKKYGPVGKKKKSSSKGKG
jgi:hypothetical protein